MKTRCATLRLHRQSLLSEYSLSRALAATAFALLSSCAAAPLDPGPADWSGDQSRDSSPEPAARGESPVILLPVEWLIQGHLADTTRMDGPRCPMYPSCSSYARDAIRNNGFQGLLLFLDRLFFREFGSLEGRYMPAPRHKSRAIRYYDPPEEELPWYREGRASLLREEF